MNRAAKDHLAERLYWTLFAMGGLAVHDATHHGWDASSALVAYVLFAAAALFAADRWRRR